MYVTEPQYIPPRPQQGTRRSASVRKRFAASFVHGGPRFHPSGEKVIAFGKVRLLSRLEVGEQLLGKTCIGPQPLQLDNKVPLPANASVAFVNENFRARQLFFEIGRHDR